MIFYLKTTTRQFPFVTHTQSLNHSKTAHCSDSHNPSPIITLNCPLYMSLFKKKLNQDDQIDRISGLPSNVIDSILQNLEIYPRPS
ncbi:hypothetical protein QL285_039177 [Trifolium repens]|nr:hypothetical protein QL285_039177 [Trifolium repens]